jgi:hypothetical protein
MIKREKDLDLKIFVNNEEYIKNYSNCSTRDSSHDSLKQELVVSKEGLKSFCNSKNDLNQLTKKELNWVSNHIDDDVKSVYKELTESDGTSPDAMYKIEMIALGCLEEIDCN